jgi:hypothetical protein
MERISMLAYIVHVYLLVIEDIQFLSPLFEQKSCFGLYVALHTSIYACYRLLMAEASFSLVVRWLQGYRAITCQQLAAGIRRFIRITIYQII